MWNGPRQGPGPRGGGPPFGGNPRGDMFEGRDGPMPDFRGRDGSMNMNMNMNMNMGNRPGQDRPPIDMRRFDGPGPGPGPQDMRGGPNMDRNMDMRGGGGGGGRGGGGGGGGGRDGQREPFRQGEEPDMSLRRQYEMEIRSKLQNSGNFSGPGRPQMDMDGRDMQGGNMRDGRFMGDMRDRPMDRPGFNNPMDQRRPGEPMGRNDNFRDMRDRDGPRMGMDDNNGFRMDMPQPGRGMMDFDRRGGMFQMSNRGRFESDMDMRNRMGPSGEFRDRDRSPGRFGDKDRMPMDTRGRQDKSSEPDGSQFRHGDTLRDREFPEELDDEAGLGGRSLSDEWRNNNAAKERGPFPDMMNRGPPPFSSRESQSDRFFPGRGGRDGRGGSFMDRDKRPGEFPEKDGPLLSLPRPDRDGKSSEGLLGRAPSKVGSEQTIPPINPALIGPNKDPKPWSREPDAPLDRNLPSVGRPPFIQDKSQMPPEKRFPNDPTPFKGPKDLPPPSSGRGILGPCPEAMLKNIAPERRDQDYRDIDYRTGSGRPYDYNVSALPGPDKDRKEPRQTPPQRGNNAGSKDQDYRSASVNDKVSHTLCISGIPKTATMEQILGAFAVRDGVPMQGMKIKNVVPGYSFDMAYVEFLNLEDAVYFMESNQGSLKVGVTTVLMKYVLPDPRSAENKSQEPPRKPPLIAEKPELPGRPPLQPTPPKPTITPAAPVKSEPPLQFQPKPHLQLPPHPLPPPPPPPPSDPGPKGAWQRNSDLTPEAWQQQVDQQQEAEQKAEAWANRNASRQHGGPRDGDPVFKESKTMIIKNLKNTTTVEMILKALDPFAYLDERNVRLVRSKPHGGNKCFCFVDMDSHEQVSRLVDVLSRARPIMVDGVRIYAEIAKPLKNQNSYNKREFDKAGNSILGYPPDMMEQQQQQQQHMHSQQQFYQNQNQPLYGPGASDHGHGLQGDMSLAGSRDGAQMGANTMLQHGMGYPDASATDMSYQGANMAGSAAMVGPAPQEPSAQHADPYIYGSDTPDLSAYLYDATSGFYYDPQTTLYYDPTSRYFYNAETQQYLYWDHASKTYIPVTGPSTEDHTISSSSSNPMPPMHTDVTIPAATIINSAPDPAAQLSAVPLGPAPMVHAAPVVHAAPMAHAAPMVNTAPVVTAPSTMSINATMSIATAPSTMSINAAVAPAPPPPPSPVAAAAPPAPVAAVVPAAPQPPVDESATKALVDGADKSGDADAAKKDKEEKPRSLAAFKIMKDMERWAKIQNRQKDSVRSPSPVLKVGSADERSSKAADAAFAIFQNKTGGDDLFKKPLAPPSKKESKRPMGSLGLLANDYAATGSDDEEEVEDKHEQPSGSRGPGDEERDKLTDWKKMACLLCRRQFPTKDALIRHQQLSDLHKQNMEIHLKIKKSKKELEALENQEKEISKDNIQQLNARGSTASPETKRRKYQHQQNWAGGSRGGHKGSDRPGLGSEPPPERKKKEPGAAWDHSTYKQAVRKAMFARFKELD
ncbi:RNA-binding protein 6 isoform X2 [Engraulis encrasicolus]|uniref:RNA-binding protein 6 isoform X2 n=1 Tax=Engraulis encrasicolus TaxID=184585 RepID=UPI002FD12447